MDDIDAMFSDLLGEMDLLTQSLEEAQTQTAPASPSTKKPDVSFNTGFTSTSSKTWSTTDLNESKLSEMDDCDLDALMADLVADLNATEEKLAAEIASGARREEEEATPPPPPSTDLPPAPQGLSTYPAPSLASSSPTTSTKSSGGNSYACSPVPASPASSLSPPPPPQHSKPSKEEIEAQIKADKIKLALEKLKEAKVKKLVVKVLQNDGSSKTLMVDERQTVRDVLDSLFEKTHCDCNVDWSVCEKNPELQLERGFEDHEILVEHLSAWTRDSQNKVCFQEREDKYAVFKSPQNFYLWNKDSKTVPEMKERDKQLLIEENFCGTSIIVPDLEGALYVKEDGKKSWKQRLFLLRASGIYYVPKGKSKTSRDLVCFVQFDNVNVYYGKEFKSKYKAPTDFCFVLKHPQIQKESQYIKYLCCDDKRTLSLWMTGIRIAKYGVAMYENYKAAQKKAAVVNAAWTNRSTDVSTASPTIKAKSESQKANGHAPKIQPGPVSKDSGDASGGISPPPPAPPPPPSGTLPPPPPDPAMPPPPPPLSAKRTSPASAARQQNNFPLPPPPVDSLPPPPPPPPLNDDTPDSPPDFLPPPPGGFGSLPPPPPPSSMNSFPPPPPSPVRNSFPPPPLPSKNSSFPPAPPPSKNSSFPPAPPPAKNSSFPPAPPPSKNSSFPPAPPPAKNSSFPPAPPPSKNSSSFPPPPPPMKSSSGGFGGVDQSLPPPPPDPGFLPPPPPPLGDDALPPPPPPPPAAPPTGRPTPAARPAGGGSRKMPPAPPKRTTTLGGGGGGGGAGGGGDMMSELMKAMQKKRGNQ